MSEAVLWAERTLRTAEVDSPRLSAELLVGRAFGLSRLDIITHHTDKPAQESLETLRGFVARRAAGEPAAYILGEREFFGLAFCVTPDVLIPRPETEGIIEEAQRLFPTASPLAFADFGTGSGALAVTLAHEFPAAHGLAVDLSRQAVAIAWKNACANGVAKRLKFLCADFLRLELPAASLDLLVANPPYVTEGEYAQLSPEIRDYEPQCALVSPEQGLAHIRGLLPKAARALRPGGVLLCELGCKQGAAALALASDPALGFNEIVILKDYAGLDRILKALRSGGNAAV